MLAESDAANVVVIAFIIIAVIVGRVVEFFRKQKAEQEAKERRARSAQAQGGEGGGSAPKAEERPVPGGLQALLDALEGRAAGQEPSPEEPAATEQPSEIWGFEEEPRRVSEAEFAAPEPVIAAVPVPVYEEPPAVEVPPEVEVSPETEAPPDKAPAPPALGAVGLLAGPGGPPLRDQARKGILWSVVLGAPRGTIPYGERGAAEAPGGVV